jgi:uncharacterized membrane protein
MNKEKFMNALKAEFNGASDADLQEILSDYEEHFANGKEAGKTEESIAAELGDPKLIAKEIRTLSLVKKAEERPTFWNVLRAILALSLFNLIFVLGPFMAAVGIIIGFFTAAISVVIAGIATIIIVCINPMIQAFDFGVHPVTLVLLAISMISLGILGVIAMYYLTKFFFRMTLKYVRLNLNLIKKGDL